MVVVAEYIWVDAFGKVRSKIRTLPKKPLKKILSKLKGGVPAEAFVPEWNFDGSSTGQAEGAKSDVILKPKKLYKNPLWVGGKSILVLCDCYDTEGNPLPSNHRSKAVEIFNHVSSDRPWFGLEQEFVLYSYKTGRPVGWPKLGSPDAQGRYYCGAGGNTAFKRLLVNRHLSMCISIGLSISGINAEVMPGQWEFQIGPCEGVDAGDQMIVAKYLLDLISEDFDVYVSYDPKPEEGDWNGSGCHVNYSSENMRMFGGMTYIEDAIEKLKVKHQEHLEVYGDNSKRLTGVHETSNPVEFTWGVGDRTASVRIPINVANDGYGYLEDRRPASDCDPYLVTSIIAQTTLISSDQKNI